MEFKHFILNLFAVLIIFSAVCSIAAAEEIALDISQENILIKVIDSNRIQVTGKNFLGTPIDNSCNIKSTKIIITQSDFESPVTDYFISVDGNNIETVSAVNIVIGGINIDHSIFETVKNNIYAIPVKNASPFALSNNANVALTLKNENILTAGMEKVDTDTDYGFGRAGLEVSKGSQITINAAETDGKIGMLTVTGGTTRYFGGGGAGIGGSGADYITGTIPDSGHIIIENGKIKAIGGMGSYSYGGKSLKKYYTVGKSGSGAGIGGGGGYGLRIEKSGEAAQPGASGGNGTVTIYGGEIETFAGSTRNTNIISEGSGTGAGIGGGGSGSGKEVKGGDGTVIIYDGKINSGIGLSNKNSDGGVGAGIGGGGGGNNNSTKPDKVITGGGTGTVTIYGGQIKAQSYDGYNGGGGAAIGGGSGARWSHGGEGIIVIENGEILAIGGDGSYGGAGAAIGGGGSGEHGNGGNGVVTIKNGTINAVGGQGLHAGAGAAIGGGGSTGSSKNSNSPTNAGDGIVTIENGTIIAVGGSVKSIYDILATAAAIGGGGGGSYSGGCIGGNGDVLIKDGTITAIAGDSFIVKPRTEEITNINGNVGAAIGGGGSGKLGDGGDGLVTIYKGNITAVGGIIDGEIIDGKIASGTEKRGAAIGGGSAYNGKDGKGGFGKVLIGIGSEENEIDMVVVGQIGSGNGTGTLKGETVIEKNSVLILSSNDSAGYSTFKNENDQSIYPVTFVVIDEESTLGMPDVSVKTGNLYTIKTREDASSRLKTITVNTDSESDSIFTVSDDEYYIDLEQNGKYLADGTATVWIPTDLTSDDVSFTKTGYKFNSKEELENNAVTTGGIGDYIQISLLKEEEKKEEEKTNEENKDGSNKINKNGPSSAVSSTEIVYENIQGYGKEELTHIMAEIIIVLLFTLSFAVFSYRRYHEKEKDE
ncbi:hypothetical protein LJC08_05525 [Methanimicrococcus sp. OttesenSCG-928-J09]|nr:hypothetical protein [Methanimicrococcus sp. OttesenSCG-928-J09]